MTIDEKIDRLLEDVAVVKTQVSSHSHELESIKTRLEPVIVHVAGVRAAVYTTLKLGAGVGVLLSCLIAALSLLK